MQIVIKFTATPAERNTTRKSTLKLLDADGDELLSVTGDLAVPDRPGMDEISIVTILGLSNVRFEKSGDYSFRILIGDDERGQINFKVVQREAAPPEG